MAEMSQLLDDGRLADLEERLELAVRRVGSPDLVDRVEDLVHRAMTRLLRVGPDTLEQLDSVSLYRLAHAELVVVVREHRRAARAPSKPQAGQTERRGELGVLVREALRRLEPARARAVTLYLLGHSVPEAALRLGEEMGQAEDLVYRGLADLRRSLAGRGI